MKSRHLIRKRIFITGMVLLSIVANTSTALAMSGGEATTFVRSTQQLELMVDEKMDINDFTDYNQNLGYGKLSGHWAEGSIQTLLDHDGISGYPEGDFRANKEITGAELIALVLKASNNGDSLTGDSWSDKIMNRAYELGIVSSDVISKADANKPITREKMAVILANSAKNILNEEAPTKLVDEATIKDLNKATPAYKDEIRTAYSMGLLAGSGNGNYNPKNSTTRAEATAIINRLFGYADRVTVKYEAPAQPEEQKPVTPEATGTYTPGVYKPLPDKSNVGSKTGYVYPAEGLLGPDGPIKRDPLTGVLGYGEGQHGGIYLGIKFANGKELGVGSGATRDTVKDMSGYYEKKGDYVYWTKEWDKIAGAMIDKLNAEHPNVADGTLADIHGNVLSTKDESNKDVFFKYYTDSDTWRPAGSLR